MEFRVIQQDDDLTHVALAGRLDAASVRETEKQFHDQTVAKKKPVLVDLSGLTFLSSMGMRMLLTAAKELGKHGAKMVLLNPHRLAELSLKAAGLDSVMPVEHDMSRALELLRNA